MVIHAESISPRSVVVATDGSDDADRAVRCAAEQAFLQRRPLAVLTAVGAAEVPAIAWGGMAAAYTYQPHELLEHARAVANEALGVVRHQHPGLEAQAVAVLGDPRQVLVDLSREVHLLVLGSRGRGVFRSKVLGSVSAAVSRDADCPVLVCRPHPRGARPGHGVLLGADGTPESLPVIEFAFEQASLLGLPLTAVHCLAEEAGSEEHRRLLAESLAGMAAKYPEVVVEQRLVRGLAEEALSTGTDEWDLVVVGRHPVDTVLRLVTAAVATTVVERARTTVAVVPQAETPEPSTRES